MADRFIKKGEINNNSRTVLLDSSVDLTDVTAGDVAPCHVHAYNRDTAATIVVSIEISDDNSSTWSEFDQFSLAPNQREVTAIPFPIGYGWDLALTSDHASGYLNYIVDARKDP